MCSGAPSIVIHTATDYTNFIANSTLVTATQLGQVVITWGAITNTQFTAVLQGKQQLDGLLIQKCRAITTLTPALDNLTTVTSGLVLDGNAVLSNVQLPMLTSVFGGLRVYNQGAIVRMRMPQLTTVGALLIYNCASLTTTSFGLLTTVNGSFTLSQLRRYSSIAITNGFPSLTTVSGQFRLYYSGRNPSTQTARSPLTLPLLQSVGSLDIRNIRVSSVSFPALTTVGGTGRSGTFTWRSLPYLRALSLPSLTLVTGRITFNTVPVLSTLCQFSLDQSGYLSSSNVRAQRSFGCSCDPPHGPSLTLSSNHL